MKKITATLVRHAKTQSKPSARHRASRAQEPSKEAESKPRASQEQAESKPRASREQAESKPRTSKTRSHRKALDAQHGCDYDVPCAIRESLQVLLRGVWEAHGRARARVLEVIDRYAEVKHSWKMELDNF